MTTSSRPGRCIPAISAALTLLLLSAPFSEAEAKPDVSDGPAVSLRPAADMLVLSRGLSASMPQLPRATTTPAAGTRIGPPGYGQ